VVVKLVGGLGGQLLLVPLDGPERARLTLAARVGTPCDLDHAAEAVVRRPPHESAGSQAFLDDVAVLGAQLGLSVDGPIGAAHETLKLLLIAGSEAAAVLVVLAVEELGGLVLYLADLGLDGRKMSFVDASETSNRSPGRTIAMRLNPPYRRRLGGRKGDGVPDGRKLIRRRR
jgi:hypothetical protein